MTTITLRSGRTLDASGDIIGLALDTDPPTVWHGYDGRISLQLDTDHDPEYHPHALTAEETADLATQMAAAWLRLRDRAQPEAAQSDPVATALRAARACIQQDRQALADSHTSVDGLDEDGAAGVAEYDEVLQQIDEALAAQARERIWAVGTPFGDDHWMAESLHWSEAAAAEAAQAGQFIALCPIGKPFPERAVDAEKLYYPREETWEESALYRLQAAKACTT